MKAVADSSPLIALASISAFHLLQPLFTEILIPEAVHQEVVVEGAGRPGHAEVRAAGWIRVRAVEDVSRVVALCQQFRIRGGEAEAIILAMDLDARWLLMDERLGCQVAVAAGIEPGRLIGTLGTLIAAKERGLITPSLWLPHRARPLPDGSAAGLPPLASEMPSGGRASGGAGVAMVQAAGVWERDELSLGGASDGPRPGGLWPVPAAVRCASFQPILRNRQWGTAPMPADHRLRLPDRQE